MIFYGDIDVGLVVCLRDQRRFEDLVVLVMGFGRGYMSFWPWVWWFAYKIGVGLVGCL